jgi:hypothetical protein
MPEEEAERERRAHVEAIERTKVERLLAEARAHHDTQLVRAYVDHLRVTSSPRDQDAFERWADWAVSAVKANGLPDGGSDLSNSQEREDC